LTVNGGLVDRQVGHAAVYNSRWLQAVSSVWLSLHVVHVLSFSQQGVVVNSGLLVLAGQACATKCSCLWAAYMLPTLLRTTVMHCASQSANKVLFKLSTTFCFFLFLAVVAIMLPTLLSSTAEAVQDFSAELALSRFESVLMLLCYALFLVFQLVTHRYTVHAFQHSCLISSTGQLVSPHTCVCGCPKRLWFLYLWLVTLQC
jgi:hypothetical protein